MNQVAAIADYDYEPFDSRLVSAAHDVLQQRLAM